MDLNCSHGSCSLWDIWSARGLARRFAQLPIPSPLWNTPQFITIVHKVCLYPPLKAAQNKNPKRDESWAQCCESENLWKGSNASASRSHLWPGLAWSDSEANQGNVLRNRERSLVRLLEFLLLSPWQHTFSHYRWAVIKCHLIVL